MGDCHGPATATLPPPVLPASSTSSPSSDRPTPANRRCSTGSPACARRSRTFPGVTVEHRMGRAKAGPPARDFRGRSARRLQPAAAHRRRARHARRAGRNHEGLAQARRGDADSGFHESQPPPVAGRAHAEPGIADAGDPQHGRRSARPRRGSGRGGAGEATQYAGGADQRVQGHRRRKGFRVPQRRAQAPAAQAAAVATAGNAGRPEVPRLGGQHEPPDELSRARAAAVDAPAGWHFPASGGRTAGVSAGGGRRFPDHLRRRAPADGRGRKRHPDLRQLDRSYHAGYTRCDR